MRILLPAVCLASVAACVDPPQPTKISTSSDALTAWEIERTYYADPGFTTEVGGDTLTCHWSRTKWGVQSSPYMVEDYFPCDGGGGVVYCYESVPTTGGTSYELVDCPAGW